MIASTVFDSASVRAADGISHAPGTRTISISARAAPERSSPSSAPCSSRSVITAFQRATTIANRIPAADRSPSTATGLPCSASSDSQKPTSSDGSSATVNSRDFQCVGATSEGRSPTSSALQLAFIHCFDNRANLVELRHFNQDRRHSRRAPRHQLQVAQRRQKCRAPPASILPALARLEAQRAQQAGQPLLRSRRSHLRHQRNSLDHPSIVSSARLPLQLQVVRCRLFVAAKRAQWKPHPTSWYA